ncbi:hypothetical protein CHS0354_015169 [Potamilus streckersoni]|uniref:Uncharacterized protein n=1 Tax=Potamilus streckersoni TaxID=2493646 RepID=A0AAE0VUN8_9BIVA|nr:hypothetical protein CHS0354_015169 [Potamilus streckersoni]
MDECEDETNGNEYAKCSEYSAQPISRPHHEAVEGRQLQCSYTIQSWRAECHEKDTKTDVPARKLGGSAGTTKTNQRPDSGQKLSGIGYSYRKRSENPHHIECKRLDASSAGRSNRKQGLYSVCHVVEKMQEQNPRDWLKDCKESSISYPDKSTPIKEFRCGYLTDRQVWEGVRKKENCSSNKLKVPVNRHTCKSKEYMGNHSSEKVKAPFNPQIYKSTEDMGNHSSKSVKVRVTGHIRESKEDIENICLQKVMAPVRELICNLTEDMGNRSSKSLKSPGNGQTCKSKEEMINRSSEKVKAPINGQTHILQEKTDEKSVRKASTEDGNSLFMTQSKMEANISGRERKQDEENVSRRRRKRGEKNNRSMQVSERIMMEHSTIYEKPEKDGSNENVIDHCKDDQTTSTGDHTNDAFHDESQSSVKPVKDRRKTNKGPVEKCEVFPDVGIDDVNENILIELKEKVQLLLEENPSEICKMLSKKKNMLKNIIKASSNDHELLIQVISLLEKALSSDVANHADYALIIVLKDTSFFEAAIVPFLYTLKIEECLHWPQHLTVLKNIIGLALIFFNRTPTSMSLIFSLLDILHKTAEYLHLIDNLNKTLQEIKEGMVALHVMKESQLSKIMKKSVMHSVSHAFRHENEQPPDNFREIEMYPQLEEIKADKPPFFRMNKKPGCTMILSIILMFSTGCCVKTSSAL